MRDSISVTTNADVERFRAVEVSSGKVTETDAVGDTVYGITGPNSADSGEDIAVRLPSAGALKCTVDGSGTSISAGDNLMPKGSGDGKLVKHDGSAGARFVARALDSSSADGDVIPVVLFSDQQDTT